MQTEKKLTKTETESKAEEKLTQNSPLLNETDLALFAARVNNVLMQSFTSGEQAAESAKLQEICHAIYEEYQRRLEKRREQGAKEE